MPVNARSRHGTRKTGWVRRPQARRLLDAGKLVEARGAYEGLVRRDPRDGESWFLLAAACGQLGDLSAAIEYGKRAVALAPSHPDARYNLGQAYRGLGQAEEAMACYRSALVLDPAHLKAHVNLGGVLLGAGRLQEAVECFQSLLRQFPNEVEGHCGLGQVQLARRHFDEAAAHFAAALRLQPGCLEAAQGLAGALLDLDRFSEAEALLRQAVKAWPGQALTWAALGKSLQGQIKLQAAAEAYQRALEIDSRCFQAHHHLAATHYDLGDIAKAISHWRTAAEINPGQPVTFSNLLMALNYDPQVDPQALAAEHRRWAELYADALPRRSLYENAPDPERVLRVGYVSPDFRAHAVAQFMAPLLRHHDRARVRIYGYSNVLQADKVTDELRESSDAWRDIAHLEDEAVADLVATDRIDLLVDLAGHSGKHRLRVFARHPAPIQITYLGYPNTTGLAAMDYRITDAWADPPGMTEGYHTEELLRIPGGFLCYERPPGVESLGAPPVIRKGFITFGSYNNIAKITPQVVAVWAELLRAVPNSRLRMKYRSLSNPYAVDSLRERFMAHGISGERIEGLGYLPRKEDHLQSYREIDIALDPFPYNGTTTTCEALWMGVPVLTLSGRMPAGRVGVSLLSQVGLEEWIAVDTGSYVEQGVRHAADVDRLTRLREDLRLRMAGSQLCDAHGFARRLEGVYRDVWRRWCECPARNARA